MNDTDADRIPRSLYVHFPWCARKCPYCDFNSHESKGPIPEDAYIDQLLLDFQAETLGDDRPITSVFLGGGTPSLFSPDAIGRLMRGIQGRFLSADIEITMEANPGSFDQQHFFGYRDQGVNRLSLGAQSFANDSLKALGRIHQSSEIIAAFDGARSAGFERINIDLMYGLPGQSIDAALSDLERAIALSPEHLSWYQLTLEPNTYFYRYPPALPSDERIADMEAAGQLLLSDSGYRRYEISAYAKPGEPSAHNLNYWHFGDYLGIGAGAHGKITTAETIFRTTKTRVPSDYLRAPGGSRQAIAEQDLPLEFLLNGLRLTGGISLAQFELTTGLGRDTLAPFISRALDRDWIASDVSGRITPTDAGLRFLNDLLLLVD